MLTVPKKTAGWSYRTELKREISQAVVQRAVRERSARVEILQEMVDRMRQVIMARAFQYAGDPVGATGMMVKDYRGKNGERAIWKFDAPLRSQINDVLKQVAIEEGQWAEKRDGDQEASTRVTIAMLNAGRDRVAEARLERDAIEARIKVGQPVAINRDIA